MGLFDLFNFKRKFQEVFTEDNFKFLRNTIKEEIKNQIKEKSKEGKKKMDAVVEAAIEYIKKYMSSDNKIVQWIVDHVLIKGIRLLTQSIYDDLKEVIKGL